MRVIDRLAQFKRDCERWALAQANNDPMVNEPSLAQFTEPWIRATAEKIKEEVCWKARNGR